MKRGLKNMYTGKAIAAIMFATSIAFTHSATAETTIPAQLLQGEMQRLALLSAPRAVPDIPFTLDSGAQATLGDYTGKALVLNFWASWCAPCRHEMPSLSRLQDMLGDDAEVLTIESGPKNPASAQFMSMLEIDNLPLHIDPQQQLARAFGVLGLPVTIIISPDGEELGRVTGDAEWDKPEVIDLINHLTD